MPKQVRLPPGLVAALPATEDWGVLDGAPVRQDVLAQVALQLGLVGALGALLHHQLLRSLMLDHVDEQVALQLALVGAVGALVHLDLVRSPVDQLVLQQVAPKRKPITFFFYRVTLRLLTSAWSRRYTPCTGAWSPPPGPCASAGG